MSDAAPEIVILAMGDMGAGLTGILTARGVRVRTSVVGRGPETQARARAADASTFTDDKAMLDGADFLLSIVPPSEAIGLAERLAPALAAAQRRPLYVDCNAVSPDTVHAVERIVTGAGAHFVDGGILGLAPTDRSKCPRIFVSGPKSASLQALTKCGLDIRVMNGPVGAASALKCAYAAIGKGIIAVTAEAILAARAAGIENYLKSELAAYQPTTITALKRDVPTLPAKSYRWVEEMRQIGTFLSSVEGGRETFLGCSALFGALAAAERQRGSDENAMDVLHDFIAAP